MSDKTSNPDYQSDEYKEMLPLWSKVDACYGGTEAMRAARVYLPQFPMEEDSVYAQRLAVSTFFPAYRDTLDGLTGTVFRKPIQIGQKVPQAIADDLENIDNAGTHYEVFGQRVFRTGVHHGATYVLVDMPQQPAVEVLDAAQAQAINFRPFAQMYSGAELANEPRYVIIDGAPVLQQIIFREESVKFDGFGETCVERFRVWTLPVYQDARENYHRAANASWQIWEKQEEDGTKETKFILIDEGVSPLANIPVAVFNANPCLTEPMESEGPIFIDLANLNIKLYQMESDHESNLHLCTPIPYDVNLRQDGEGDPGLQQKFAWGAGIWVHTDTGGSLGYAEPRGTGLVQREAWIKGIKQQLIELGLALAQEGSQQGGAMTATEAMLKGGTRASRMTQLARAFQDCMEQVLVYWAQWKGLYTGVANEVEVTLGVKDADLVINSQDVSAYAAMQTAGQLSLKTLWAIIGRGGILPDDFDAEQELKNIADEKKALAVVTPPPVINFNQPGAIPAKQPAQPANNGGVTR
jgi:hypothetical protein